MTIEELKVRVTAIEESMKRLVAQYNVLEGNKQEAMHWIAQLEEKAKNTDDCPQ